MTDFLEQLLNYGMIPFGNGLRLQESRDKGPTYRIFEPDGRVSVTICLGQTPEKRAEELFGGKYSNDPEPPVNVDAGSKNIENT